MFLLKSWIHFLADYIGVFANENATIIAVCLNWTFAARYKFPFFNYQLKATPGVAFRVQIPDECQCESELNYD